MAKIKLTLPVTGSGGSSGNTNLSYISSPIQGTVTSDTGSDATIPLADNTNAGLLDPSKYTVLENIRGINTGDQDLQQVTTVGSTTTDKISVIIPTGNVNALSLQNNGTAATLTAENGLGVAIFGKSNVGYGVYGETVSSVGVSGYASGSGSGVFGNSITGAAINGSSGSGIAIYGTSTTGVGLQISTPLTNNSNLANFYHNNVSVANISKFGDITSNSFKIPTGTSSQFLKADGSLDSNTYLTSLTGAELLVNKQNSLAVDGTGTKYPTVDAVNAAIPASYAVVVYVNATSPNTSTIFDDVNPPVTNDDTLKIDTDNLYIGTDASTWVYDDTTYITKTIPASSNFKIVGTGVDAGSNKTASIFREGSIGSDAFVSSNAGMFINRNGSNTAQNGGFMAFSNAAASNINMFQLNASNGLDLWNYASGTWNKRFTFSSGGNFTASTYNGYTPANDNAVVHLTGNETIAGVKRFSPSISASTNLAIGTIINPSLTATANNDVLVGLDIAPSFTNGVFTGVKNYGIRSVSGLFTGTLSTPLTIERTNSSNINIEYKNNTSSVYAGVCNALAFGIGSSADLTTSSNLKVFTGTGNTVLQNGGSSTDDGVNRLQVTGTVSSGTTTLGNTPPTANNQLTRKDYVDTKAPTASPTFTGTPIAPTATVGTNTTQLATTAFVQAANGNFWGISGNSGTTTSNFIGTTDNIDFTIKRNTSNKIVLGYYDTNFYNLDTGSSSRINSLKGTNLTNSQFTTYNGDSWYTNDEYYYNNGSSYIKEGNFSVYDNSYINTKGGNFGINTKTPSEKLEVVGNVKATSYTGGATLTGTPTAPTATVGTNTTQIATTAFVQSELTVVNSDFLLYSMSF